mmetsp:Transcript_1389/g.3256  ORF Transcript_1389/g.3256 Transcript_1389/m.3256 type:complete len:86 (+) Transcript_1389:197-454(+)
MGIKQDTEDSPKDFEFTKIDGQPTDEDSIPRFLQIYITSFPTWRRSPWNDQAYIACERARKHACHRLYVPGGVKTGDRVITKKMR